MDPATRTAQARIEVANPGDTLRIEMYVRCGDEPYRSQTEGHFVIFRRQKQKLPFADGIARAASGTIGPGAPGDENSTSTYDYYSVPAGLNAQDEVVTDGSFILKAGRREIQFSSEFEF